MSRIAKAPVELPGGVEFSQSGNVVTMKGSNGTLTMELNSEVELTQEDNALMVKPRSGSRFSTAIAGTMRALLANMAKGVSTGFERKLELVGVGYRAQAQGKTLNLTLGFSHPVVHPVVHEVPEGVTVETPSQTEIIVKGADKQKVGQVAAEIRGYRPPEPYKGKGVRYSDERVVIKEAKKK
jgi:large subunit ribosomal protein L6